MIGDLIGEWIKGILIDGIMGNLSGLFNTVNTKVGEIASDVGSTPQDWNGGIFSMLQNLSETVIVPIAAAILALEAALNQLIDGNSDLVMETIKESITYYSGLQQLSFGVLLIVAVIVVCFSLINLVNTTITNFLSRRQEIGMLQAIGLSKKQLIKMLCYEGLMYSVFATLVTLVLGTGLGFLSVQVVVKTMNPYFYYSFPWLIVLIYLAILLIVQFTLISYTTGNLKKQSLVEQIRTME